LNKFFI